LAKPPDTAQRAGACAQPWRILLTNAVVE
jgi:hypothetical protein